MLAYERVLCFSTANQMNRLRGDYVYPYPENSLAHMSIAGPHLLLRAASIACGALQHQALRLHLLQQLP